MADGARVHDHRVLCAVSNVARQITFRIVNMASRGAGAERHFGLIRLVSPLTKLLTRQASAQTMHVEDLPRISSAHLRQECRFRNRVAEHILTNSGIA